jgi:predicted deacylase
MPPTPGTLSTVAIEAGIAAIGCEVEGTGGLNHSDSEIYLNGLINVLRFTNQIKNDGFKLQGGEFHPIETILSPADGFIESFSKLYTSVKAGDSICEILDYFGNPVMKISAPSEGTLWAVRRNPSITKGEILAILSLEGVKE